MPTLNDLQAAARDLTLTPTLTPSANQPLRMLPEEAQLLLDLRPALQDPARCDRARALRRQLFGLVRERLGVPPDIRLRVEVDDQASPDYLVLKNAGTGERLYPASSPSPVQSPSARWYMVVDDEGDADDTFKPVDSALSVCYISETPADDLGVPPVRGMTLTRIVDGRPVTYVALTAEQYEDADIA